MIVRSAILPFGPSSVAAFLVDLDLTYPEPARAFIAKVQHLHPTLGIFLISPRVRGFSRTYAPFELGITGRLNTDLIKWVEQDASILPERPLPF